jgi:hypothetical protein
MIYSELDSIDAIYMVYYGECKLTKLHIDSDKKPNSLGEVKENMMTMRTVVNLSKK